ncbi:MAG: PQQ-dependent sugar dehydrogenase [Halioglobus sp.]|nr:PQQ-dependent sugar dehydrogenase [Halioglobus sp.]
MINIFRLLVGCRLGRQRLSPLAYATWSIFSCFLLITLPVFLYQGLVLWGLPLQRLLPFYMLSVGYLLYAVLLYVFAQSKRGITIHLAIVLGIVCFVVSIGGLYFVAELEFSRLVLISSIILGLVLAITPLLCNAGLFRLLRVILLLLVVVLVFWMSSRGERYEEEAVDRVNSALYVMDRADFPVVPTKPDVQGGGLVAQGDGFIAVTGDGEFYRLDWSVPGDELVAARLPLDSPLEGREAFYARDKGRVGFPFRVTDLLVQPTTGGDQLLVAHQIWNPDEKCFTLGVSRAALPEADDGDMELRQWTRIYETQPCVELPIDPVETGGRLAWLSPGRLLMTTGDHGKDGRNEPALSQDLSADYGKVLVLDLHGTADVFTSGHRNPQGLLVDAAGQIWVTEHGPAGGDEINRLDEGGNYGWPLATYGTWYGQRTWPLNPDGKNHGEFIEPVHAFVPGIAISNLIQLGGAQFPRWEGDLLIATLKSETLFRLRLHGNRVVYAEPIFVGERVRDLVQAKDGRIVLWTDDEEVTVLSRRMNPNAGREVYSQCQRCHEPVGSAQAIAPSLHGVLGRRIASVPGFDYSPALRSIKGNWDVQMLDAFLDNPSAFAPGTAMAAYGVPDDADRAALIRYLETQ